MKKINAYISKWKEQGYPEDIPDECPAELESTGLVPSYKQIALCLLKNDHNFVGLGFSPPKSPWYSAIKRVEIAARGQKNQVKPKG